MWSQIEFPIHGLYTFFNSQHWAKQIQATSRNISCFTEWGQSQKLTQSAGKVSINKIHHACWNHEIWDTKMCLEEQMSRSYPLLQTKVVCHKEWKSATAGWIESGIESGIMCRRGTKLTYWRRVKSRGVTKKILKSCIRWDANDFCFCRHLCKLNRWQEGYYLDYMVF